MYKNPYLPSQLWLEMDESQDGSIKLKIGVTSREIIVVGDCGRKILDAAGSGVQDSESDFIAAIPFSRLSVAT
ncbi:hypothetical protein L596_009285 [Steinernema carpocapsae]|uniref:Uncharacterized protein n=1 Tax=Steinernema carpocapsae TaxID=34508 RepID=A0A4U5PEW9_STECR|nr:hypothetical protein L596_009285 [Steinernema carpocapsae]